VATLVGGITTQGHYFVFLVFPLTVMAARLGRHLTVQSATAFALLLASLGWQATMASEFLDRHLAWKVAANNLPLAGLLGLTWFFAVELNRRTNVS
jgi:hypothetical protein